VKKVELNLGDEAKIQDIHGMLPDLDIDHIKKAYIAFEKDNEKTVDSLLTGAPIP